MGSKPRNYPTLKEVIYPTLTPEENRKNIEEIKAILILIGVHHLTNKRETPKKD